MFTRFALIFLAATIVANGQEPPYDVVPDVAPPYYRVRYEASTKPGELVYPVKYTIWIPEGVETLRGVVVHQHGCGEGSCKSGLTGAFDLHWQALAEAHDCALLSPSYEQPQDANCALWCDPRNGSAETFLQSLVDLGAASGHPELSKVPWALWGHSGGGHWCGGMTMLYPERVAATWLRSGAPLVEKGQLPDRPELIHYEIADEVLSVPIMCNPGTKEGVTEKEGRFAGVWPAMERLLGKIRSRGGVAGAAIDPLTGHECGNQRYFAIPWLDHCLEARLPLTTGEALRPMPSDDVWLAGFLDKKAVPAAEFTGDKAAATWLPSEAIAKLWEHYVVDTTVPDTTPPPAPTDVKVDGQQITWTADGDLESGVARFHIERDGEIVGTVPESAKNRFGRPIFQGLQFSDTPLQPLRTMTFTDTTAREGGEYSYRIISENTVGLRSE